MWSFSLDFREIHKMLKLCYLTPNGETKQERGSLLITTINKQIHHEKNYRIGSCSARACSYWH